MPTSKVGENIKRLRLSFGETQMELAYALGLESPNAITNYEKEHSMPKRDVLSKIAFHYRVTIDELIYGTIPEFDLTSLPIDNKDIAIKIVEVLCPIIYTAQASQDNCFQKGYEAHMRLYNSMICCHEFNEFDFEQCIESYAKSLDENSTPESAANLLWWLIITELVKQYSHMSKAANALYRKSISKKTFLHKHYLRDCDTNGECIPIQVEKAEDIHDDDDDENDTKLHLLKILNASPKWYHLTQYYVAIEYLYGVVNNGHSIDINRVVGEEMIQSMVRVGNPYAEKFLAFSEHLLRNNIEPQGT